MATELFVNSLVGTGTSLVQFSIGFKESSVLTGVEVNKDTAQVSVLERWADGSPRTARVYAPVPGGVTSIPGQPGVLKANIQDGGKPHSMSGKYGGMPIKNLSLDLTPSDGGVGTYLYRASGGVPTQLDVLVGPGSDKDATGGDYFRTTRYVCPFIRQDKKAPLETCGAAILYVQERTDYPVVVVQLRVTSSTLQTTDDGSGAVQSPYNPGRVVFESLKLNLPDAYSHFTVDQFSGAGGVQGDYLAAPFAGESEMHVLHQGVAPGWTVAIYNPSKVSPAIAEAIAKGADMGFAYGDLGFDNPDLGYGEGRYRHVDWRDYGKSLSALDVTANSEADDVESGLNTGLDTGPYRADRGGFHVVFGPGTANDTGGELIYGSHCPLPTPGWNRWLRLASEATSRRENHLYYFLDKGRQIQSSDFTIALNDTGNAGGEVSGPTQVTTFQLQDSGTYSQSINPEVFTGFGLGTIEIASNGPTNRPWNSLGASENLGAPQEDPAIGYNGIGAGWSPNLGHCSRGLLAREAYLFAGCFLAYDSIMGWGTRCASTYISHEPQWSVQRYRFLRDGFCLQAWGDRDLFLTAQGSARPVVRRRNSNMDLSGTTNPNWGDKVQRNPANRVLGWSMVWMATAYGVSDDEYRSAMLPAPATATGEEHSPFRLFARAMGRWANTFGFLSAADTPNSGVNPYQGTADFPSLSGALPGGPHNSANPSSQDGQHWPYAFSFMDDYMALGLDASASILQGNGEVALVQELQEALTKTYWLAVQAAPFPEAGSANGRIGINKFPVMSVGTAGLDIVANGAPGSSPNTQIPEAQWRAGVGYWHPGNVGSNYGHELQNHTLGWLVALRWIQSIPNRDEARALLRLTWDLSPTASVTDLLAAIAADNDADTGVPSRSTPFLGEGSSLL